MLIGTLARIASVGPDAPGFEIDGHYSVHLQTMHFNFDLTLFTSIHDFTLSSVDSDTLNTSIAYYKILDSAQKFSSLQPNRYFFFIPKSTTLNLHIKIKTEPSPQTKLSTKQPLTYSTTPPTYTEASP